MHVVNTSAERYVDAEVGPMIWNFPGSRYRNYTKIKPILSILLIKADHIGDFILALDAFLLIRKAFPDAAITILCGPWNAELARSTGIFDQVETVDFFAARSDAIQPTFDASRVSLPADAFDLVVDLRADYDTRVLLNYINATYRCGFDSDTCVVPMTFTIPQVRPSSDNPAAHQRMMMMSLAHSVVEFFAPEKTASANIKKSLSGIASVDLSFAADRLLVVVNPFSGRAAKNWPIERFKLIVSWLCETMDVSVALLGTKADLETAAALTDLDHLCNFRSFVGSTTLPEALSVVSRSDLYVGNDTALTHAAARSGTPTIAIYSGIDPTICFAPFGENVTVIKAPTQCSPCHILSMSDCRYGHACIQAVGLDFVKGQIRQRLLELSVPTGSLLSQIS